MRGERAGREEGVETGRGYCGLGGSLVYCTDNGREPHSRFETKRLTWSVVVDFMRLVTCACNIILSLVGF